MTNLDRGPGLESRLSTLERRHIDIEAEIIIEMNSVVPNRFRIHRLERLRLRIKDEIASITGLMRTLNRPIEQGAA